MYELMEQRYPFGSHPKYVIWKEFVQPNLYDDPKLMQKCHICDLLALYSTGSRTNASAHSRQVGLLSCKPIRIGTTRASMTSPSTGNWWASERWRHRSATSQKLVDSFFLKESEEIEEAQGRRRRMSSRTKGLAEMLKSSEEHEALDPSFGRETWSFKTRVSSYHLQSSKGGGGHSMEEKSRQSFSHDTADDDFDEMYVEGWEFNSPHAIAAEYVERHADHVSVL